MSIPLSPDARARLDVHLDAVEAALVKAGNTREQRRGVLDDLESQILDMLAQRSSSPAIADVDAVLATLDSPLQYASGRGEDTPPTRPAPSPTASPEPPILPRYSRTAVWGFVCVLLSIVPPLLVIPLLFFVAAPVQRRAMSHSVVIQQSPAVISLSPPVPATREQPVKPANLQPPSDQGLSPEQMTQAEILGQVDPQMRSLLLERNVVQSNYAHDFAMYGANHPSVRQSSNALHDIDNRIQHFLEAHPMEAQQTASSWSFFGIIPCLLALVGPLGILGTVLGWVAFAQIRRSNGAITGRGLALFDGLFWPLILLAPLAILILRIL